MLPYNRLLYKWFLLYRFCINVRCLAFQKTSPSGNVADDGGSDAEHFGIKVTNNLKILGHIEGDTHILEVRSHKT